MTELLKYDLKLQWRHGFWLVYFLVSAIYLLILFSLPPQARPTVSLFLVLTDTTMLGVMFVGALVLLEKQQNVMQSLFVTPLRPASYLLSKTISLTLLAFTMSMLVYIPASGFDRSTILLMLLIILSSSLFVLLGIGVSASVSTLNQYLGRLIVICLFIIIPVVPFILVSGTGWLRLFPANAFYDLAMAIHTATSGLMVMADLLILLFWLVISWLYANNRFKRKILGR